MKPAWQAPAFSTAAWYSDPLDPRCPQDARFDSVDIREPAGEIRGETRDADIVLKLLGARGDGFIVFSYFGVRRHSLCAYLCDQGAGAWLRDEFVEAEDGLTTHRIVWRSEAGGISRWWIEAEKTSHAWLPNVPARDA